MTSEKKTKLNLKKLSLYFYQVKGILMSRFLRVLVIIATTIARQQKAMFGVMGGTPLRNRRHRRLHSVTKSLNLSPQRSYKAARWIGQIVNSPRADNPYRDLDYSENHKNRM